MFWRIFFSAGPAPAELYTLSLHDALPISRGVPVRTRRFGQFVSHGAGRLREARRAGERQRAERQRATQDRKSTRLNSSHSQISYAVFCLKKKKTTATPATRAPTR